MSPRNRLCWVSLLLLAAAWPAEVRAAKVAVMEMEGNRAAAVQASFVANLGGGHTLVIPEEVSAVAQRLGLGATCIAANIPNLARTLQVSAVICGEVERKKLVLTVYNGADGKLVGTVDVRLRKGKLTKRNLTRAKPTIERVLAMTAAPTAAPVPTQSADPLQQALKVLASPVANNRIAALGALSRQSGWKAARPMACTLLNDADLSVRQAAASHLGRMHDLAGVTAMRAAAVLETDTSLKQKLRTILMGLRQRVDALSRQVQDPDPNRREAAVKALAMGAYAQALVPLLKAMQDADAKVRLRAVEGLRQFAKPKARAALAAAMRDSDANVRKTTSTYIQEHQRLAGWRAFYRSYLRVIKHSESTDVTRRIDSVVALGVSGETNAVKRLSKMMLSDPDEGVRIAVAWALVLLGKKRGEAAMRIAVDNDSSEKARKAIRAYLDITKADVDALVKGLSSADSAERQQSAASLSLRPTKAVRPHLVKSALCDPDTSVRAVALRGLARGGDPLSLTTIKLLMFRDPAPDVQRVATMMYVLVGWEEAAGPEQRVAKKKARWDTEDPNKQKHAVLVKKQQEAAHKPVTPSCPLGCRALQASVGGSSLFVRNYSVENPANTMDEEGLTSLPVAGFNLGVEVYPATWFTKNWLANFGIGLSYAHYFGLQWKTNNDPDVINDITHEVFTVDFLRVRWQPARRARVPTLYGRFGLRYMGFYMNDEDVPEAHIPDINATSLSVGVAMKVPIRSAHLLIGVDYLPMMSWGEVTEDDEFGSGSGMGLLGTVGFGGPFSKLLGWRVDLTYTLYMLDLDRVEGFTTRPADSIVDMYFHGSFSLTFNL